MSLSTLDMIIDRIKSAPEESPIAVFREPMERNLNAVFADTVKTRKWMKYKEKLFVGNFHQNMDAAEVKMKLKAALK